LSSIPQPNPDEPSAFLDDPSLALDTLGALSSDMSSRYTLGDWFGFFDFVGTFVGNLFAVL
jgi:hypothetical protein